MASRVFLPYFSFRPGQTLAKSPGTVLNTLKGDVACGVVLLPGLPGTAVGNDARFGGKPSCGPDR
jgi:hypothetical protein